MFKYFGLMVMLSLRLFAQGIYDDTIEWTPENVQLVKNAVPDMSAFMKGSGYDVYLEGDSAKTARWVVSREIIMGMARNSGVLGRFGRRGGAPSASRSDFPLSTEEANDERDDDDGDKSGIGHWTARMKGPLRGPTTRGFLPKEHATRLRADLQAASAEDSSSVVAKEWKERVSAIVEALAANDAARASSAIRGYRHWILSGCLGALPAANAAQPASITQKSAKALEWRTFDLPSIAADTAACKTLTDRLDEDARKARFTETKDPIEADLLRSRKIALEFFQRVANESSGTLGQANALRKKATQYRQYGDTKKAEECEGAATALTAGTKESRSGKRIFDVFATERASWSGKSTPHTKFQFQGMHGAFYLDLDALASEDAQNIMGQVIEACIELMSVGDGSLAQFGFKPVGEISERAKAHCKELADTADFVRKAIAAGRVADAQAKCDAVWLKVVNFSELAPTTAVVPHEPPAAKEVRRTVDPDVDESGGTRVLGEFAEVSRDELAFLARHLHRWTEFASRCDEAAWSARLATKSAAIRVLSDRMSLVESTMQRRMRFDEEERAARQRGDRPAIENVAAGRARADAILRRPVAPCVVDLRHALRRYNAPLAGVFVDPGGADTEETAVAELRDAAERLRLLCGPTTASTVRANAESVAQDISAAADMIAKGDRGGAVACVLKLINWIIQAPLDYEGPSAVIAIKWSDEIFHSKGNTVEAGSPIETVRQFTVASIISEFRDVLGRMSDLKSEIDRLSQGLAASGRPASSVLALRRIIAILEDARSRSMRFPTTALRGFAEGRADSGILGERPIYTDRNPPEKVDNAAFRVLFRPLDSTNFRAGLDLLKGDAFAADVLWQRQTKGAPHGHGRKSTDIAAAVQRIAEALDRGDKAAAQNLLDAEIRWLLEARAPDCTLIRR